jgi:transposase
MEKKKKGKIYNDDFKKTIVELYHTGSSVSGLSSEYGVSEVTIYKWIKSLTPIDGIEDNLTPQDMAAMRKENLRMKQEIEILKKAMAIFARK